MQIQFDTEKFAGIRKGDQSLSNVLFYLKKAGCITPCAYPSIEKVTCRTPSGTLRYCKLFASAGVSSETEAVFLKNPVLGVRYLRMIGRSEFSDPSTQRRFRKKFKTDALLACEWAKAFGRRVSEEEEEVFRKSIPAAREYAMKVLRGKFPEKVHSMILLASFQDMNNYAKRCLSEYIKFAETNPTPVD